MQTSYKHIYNTTCSYMFYKRLMYQSVSQFDRFMQKLVHVRPFVHFKLRLWQLQCLAVRL